MLPLFTFYWAISMHCVISRWILTTVFIQRLAMALKQGPVSIATANLLFAILTEHMIFFTLPFTTSPNQKRSGRRQNPMLAYLPRGKGPGSALSSLNALSHILVYPSGIFRSI